LATLFDMLPFLAVALQDERAFCLLLRIVQLNNYRAFDTMAHK
jgi:hypothetical protein